MCWCKMPLDLVGKISCRALVLYSLMRDRLNLSLDNPLYHDSAGEPFVVFTRDSVCSLMSLSSDQVKEVFKELETVGLIRRVRQGQGKPMRIYVADVFQTAEKSTVKTAEKSTVKTAEKSTANQIEHNQTKYIQSSSDDDAIKQIIDNYCKLPQFADITPDIADFVAKNVINAIKKRKIANIKAYIRTCLVSAPADYATQAQLSAVGTYSGYPATYDIAAYESVSAADSEVLDD